MQGTKALRDSLGEAGWNTFLDDPEKLDRIAFVLTFREDPGSIRKGLEDIGLAPLILEALMTGVVQGDFSEFKGAAHISAKVCRSVIPHLRRGLVYDKAMAEAGYRHTDRAGPTLDGKSHHENMKRQIAWASERIANPVAKKALTEALKQVNAIVAEYGLPGHIHVELARDVGKSQEERDEIRSGIEKRNKAKDRLTEQFREEIGGDPSGREDLLRFELWKEQNGRCLYTDTYIDPRRVVASDNSVQVDHILPWHRSGDDSFVNKTLCLASANQEKKGRTPHEWFGKDEARWHKFVEGVENNKAMKGRKKRNYLLKDIKKLEEKFRPRNLNDTKYATRLLLDALAQWYPDDVRNGARGRSNAERSANFWFEDRGISRLKVRVSSRPGQLTDLLRRGWGLQDLKKTLEPDGEKRKADDRHHALDALIVAATDQSALAKLTLAVQEERRMGGHRDFADFQQPWPGFIAEVREKFVRIFVRASDFHVKSVA
jgi:CRISPR-associated endonuclease Csn1